MESNKIVCLNTIIAGQKFKIKNDNRLWEKPTNEKRRNGVWISTIGEGKWVSDVINVELMENSRFLGDVITEGNIDVSKLIVGGSYRIMEPPKYKGSWNLGTKMDNGKGYLQIFTVEKPKWFHRVMMKLLLGIWWIENEK